MIKAYYEKNYYRDETRNVHLWNRLVLIEESEAKLKNIPVDTFEELLRITQSMSFWVHTIHHAKKGIFKPKTVVTYDIDCREYIDEHNFTQGEFTRCYVEAKIRMNDLMEQPADLVIQYMKERGLSVDC